MKILVFMLQDHQGHIERKLRFVPEVPPVMMMIREPTPQLTTAPFLDRFDLPYLLGRYKFPLLVAPVLCGLIAFVFFSLQTPLYESSATLLVDPNFDRMVQIERVEPQIESGMEALKSLEVALIADSIILRVIHQLNLRDEAGFLPQSLATKEDLSDAEMLHYLKKDRLKASLLPETRLIQISVLDPSPERAQKLAAAFSTEFEAFLLQQRNEKMAKSRLQIEYQADIARRAALHSDEKLRQFRLDNLGLVVEQDHNLFSQRLTEIGTELNRVRQDRSLYEGREKVLRELDPRKSPIDIVEVAGYKDLDHVSGLLNSLSTSKARLGSVTQSFRQTHPVFQSALAEVAGNEQLLVSLAGDIKKAISSSLHSLRERENRLKTELGEAVEELGRVKSLSSEFRAIQQQAEKEWAAYAAMQQKLTESEVASVWSHQIATLVSPPLLPFEIAKPKVLLAGVSGGLAGCFLSGAALLFLLIKGAPVSHRTQLEEQFRQFPLIGEFSPQNKFQNMSSSSGLIQFLAQNHAMTLVTSLGNVGSGTFIAEQMASTAARYGRNTILLKIWNRAGDRDVRRLGPNLYQLGVNSSHIRNVSRLPVDLAHLRRNFDQVFIEADETEDAQLIELIGNFCDHRVVAAQSGETLKSEIAARVEKLANRQNQSVSLLLISES